MFDQYNNQENEKQEYNAGFDSNANGADNNAPNQQSASEPTEGWKMNPQAGKRRPVGIHSMLRGKIITQNHRRNISLIQQTTDKLIIRVKRHHRGSPNPVIHSRSNTAAITLIPIIIIRV